MQEKDMFGMEPVLTQPIDMRMLSAESVSWIKDIATGKLSHDLSINEFNDGYILYLYTIYYCDDDSFQSIPPELSFIIGHCMARDIERIELFNH